VRIRSEEVHADHHMRLGELRGGFEIAPVEIERNSDVVGRKMGGEGERESEFSREACAEVARTEEVNRNVQSRARNGAQQLPRRGRREVGPQLSDVLRKGIATRAEIPTQSAGGELIPTWRAPQPEIDPARVKRFQRAE